MKLSEIFKNNDIELTEQQEQQLKELLGIKETKKWMPKQDEDYYCIDQTGSISISCLQPCAFDEYNIATNNYFKTIDDALFKLEQIKVYNELKNFAEEHNDKLEWTKWKKANEDIGKKWYIVYDYSTNSFIIDYQLITREIGCIYFSSLELATQALQEVGADRIKKYLFGVDK